MSTHPLRVVFATLALLPLAFAACTENTTDPGPTTGSVTVTVTTMGTDLDVDGYTLTIGVAVESVGANGTASFSDLTPGSVSVTLGGIAANCSPSASNPQMAMVVAGQTAAVTFTVTCAQILEDMVLMAAARNGDLVILDPTTGGETNSFTPMIDDGAGGKEPLGVISSMLHIPATDAWWLGLGGNSVCNRGSGCVARMDFAAGSTSGDAVMVGETGVNDAVPGLAMHPTTGKIYTFQADAGCCLYELDPTTAAGVEVMDNLNDKSQGKGATFSRAGLLYLASSDELLEIDVDAGTSDVVAAFTYTGFPAFADPSQSIGSMTTRASDGVVFGILKDGGGGGTVATYLVTIDLATAEVTNVGATATILDGLAFIPARLVD